MEYKTILTKKSRRVIASLLAICMIFCLTVNVYAMQGIETPEDILEETPTPEPETTTPEPETTTPEPETTIPEPESTTSEPESETTTPEPETTTPEPETTIPEPETTTPEPETTTPEPETTTPEPETTTPEPETTTPEPETTTPEPETTTPEPETTTPEPETTTPEPETTTPEPETTTPEPETTTPEPETTTPTPEPETTTPEPETKPVSVQAKMDMLLEKLGANGGKTVYFTVNQKACASYRKNNHGCSNCDTANIVKTAWFKDIFGPISTSQFPAHYGSAYGSNNTGRSCFGFACFAQWYACADSSTEKLVGDRVATIRFKKSDIMNNVKPGDVLRVANSHSVLVYAVEEDGIVVIDSNWSNGSQLNCVVQKHKILYNSSYSGRTVYVNRVKKDLNISETPGGGQTGWIQDDKGTWYYISPETGKPVTGWMQTEAKLWYYMDPEEAYMLADCWLCDPDSGIWYYLDQNGAMCTSWIITDGIWYYLDQNGAMCTGWNIINKKWYLFAINGSMLTGWQEVGGKYYYMTDNGDCLLDTVTPDGHRVDKNGARM